MTTHIKHLLSFSFAFCLCVASIFSQAQEPIVYELYAADSKCDPSKCGWVVKPANADLLPRPTNESKYINTLDIDALNLVPAEVGLEAVNKELAVRDIVVKGYIEEFFGESTLVIEKLWSLVNAPKGFSNNSYYAITNKKYEYKISTLNTSQAIAGQKFLFASNLSYRQTYAVMYDLKHRELVTGDIAIQTAQDGSTSAESDEIFLLFPAPWSVYNQNRVESGGLGAIPPTYDGGPFDL